MKERRKLAKKFSVRAVLYGIIITLFFVGLQRYPQYQDIYPLSQTSILYVILFFGGLYLRRTGKDLRGSLYEEKFYPLMYSIGAVMIGAGFYIIYRHLDLPQAFQSIEFVIDNLVIIIAVIMGLLAITTIFFYGKNIDRLGISRLCRGILDSQKIIIYMSVIFAFYFLYIRDALSGGYRGTQVVHTDWAMIVILSMILIWITWGKINKRIAADRENTYRGKHVQEVESFEDEKLKDLESVQKEFVEDGKKEYLLIYLVDLMKSEGRKLHQSGRASLLNPLIYYEDTPVPSFGYRWWRERVKKKNKERRKKILDRVTKDIIEETNLKIERIYGVEEEKN